METPLRFEIPKINDNLPRPLWSVMIPTYNCTAYLAEALSSVLRQDPGPDQMQIEVIDDYSTDGDPEAIVNSIGGGRVCFYRQPQNVGHIYNFETCLRRSRGSIIHLLHGDDFVRQGFYKKLQKPFEKDSNIGAAFTRHFFINEAGKQLSISSLEQSESGLLHNQIEKLATEQRIMTPSIVVRRDVYEKLGGFDRRLVCSEDWEMWVRIASHYPIWYETEPLAVYRMHNISNTGRHIKTGEDISYTRLAIKIFKPYLPPDISDNVTRLALRTYAKSAIDAASKMFLQKDYSAMRAQLSESFKCSHNLSVYSHLLKMTGKTLSKLIIK